MLKHISIAAVFMVISVGTLSAQNERQVNINVSAIVNGASETITIQTIDFENIVSFNSIITIDPVTSPRSGKMVARGAPDAEFQINYLQQRELDNSTGSGTIIFNYQIAGNIVDEQSTAEILDQEVRDLSFNNDGEYFIWVGGFTDLSDAEPGNYEGEFTIEIEYI
jgi:hypothetical protein